MKDPAATARKLLSLSRSGKSPEHRSARARALDIARTYHLSEADLRDDLDEEGDVVHAGLGSYTERHYWCQVLATAIAKSRDCQAAWVGTDIVLVGSRGATRSAQALYAALVAEVAGACERNLGEARRRIEAMPSPQAEWLTQARADAFGEHRLSARSSFGDFDSLFGGAPPPPPPPLPPPSFDSAFAKLFYANFAETVARRLGGAPAQRPPVPGAPAPAPPPGAAELKESVQEDAATLGARERAALGEAIRSGVMAGERAALLPPPRMLPIASQHPEAIRSAVDDFQRRIGALRARVGALCNQLDGIAVGITRAKKILARCEQKEMSS